MDIFNGELRITARESALSGFAEVKTITVEELYQAFVKREADDFQELLDEPETFESELHALITKYDLNHSDLTPEHIKQQVMKDNLADHNKAVKARHSVVPRGSMMEHVYLGPGDASLLNPLTRGDNNE